MSEKMEKLLEGVVSKLDEFGKRLNSLETEKEKRELPKPIQKPIPTTQITYRENADQNVAPVTFEELTDPRQPDVSRLNKFDDSARIIKLYSAEFPNGGIF